MWLPKRPQSLDEAKLEKQYIEDCILKYLNARGATRGGKFPEILKIPYGLMDFIIQDLRDRDLIATVGGGSGLGGNSGLSFGLTSKGMELADVAARRSPYFGPAPVDLVDYTQSVQAQKFQSNLVRRQHLERAFSDIKISQEYLNQLGPAINSGGPIFLYGKPGNGKTTMSERIARLYRQGIFVPYTIQINGEIIQVFDPKIHKPIPIEILPEDHPLRVDPNAADPRWVYAFRPFIVVGGELTLEMLDLTFISGQASYEAPFQLKANGGVLLIDDFGRQKVKPTEFLNRWIYPLEKGMDFLSLASGRKIEVPFEQLIILSTNLDPKDLGDEAFWRRIKYMIETPSPTASEYKFIFQTICAKKNIVFDEEVFNKLVEKYYVKAKREFRSVHPRDILNRISDFISYFGLESKLTPQVVDQACTLFFGGQAAQSSEPTEEVPPPVSVQAESSIQTSVHRTPAKNIPTIAIEDIDKPLEPMTPQNVA